MPRAPVAATPGPPAHAYGGQACGLCRPWQGWGLAGSLSGLRPMAWGQLEATRHAQGPGYRGLVAAEWLPEPHGSLPGPT